MQLEGVKLRLDYRPLLAAPKNASCEQRDHRNYHRHNLPYMDARMSALFRSYSWSVM